MERLIRKELRTIALPAAVVLVMGLVGGFGSARPDSRYWSSRMDLLLEWLFMLACFVGPPTIMAWPFGAEFRHGTMPMLLSQPVSRTRVWLVKWLTSALALGLVVGAGFLVAMQSAQWMSVVRPVALLYLAAVASAPFWTVIARSTVGGAALTIAAMVWFELAISYGWAYLNGTVHSIQFGMAIPALDVARAGYALITCWLGWRAFARFETVDRTSLSLSAGAHSAGWSPLRARRSGVIANLVRKELMLLRPLFVIAGVFVVTWILAYMFTTPRTPLAAVAAFVILVVYVPIAAVLSGTISMAEEMSLGVRAWQLTVPVAARTQWAVKLVVALAAAFLLVLVLPAAMLAVAPVGAMPYMNPRGAFETFNFVMLAGIVLLGLWSAALFVDGVAAAVGSVSVAASLLLLSVSAAMLSFRWGATPTYTIVSAVAMFIPSLGLALWQSYAAFRRIQMPRGTILRMSFALAVTAGATAVAIIAASRLPI